MNHTDQHFGKEESINEKKDLSEPNSLRSLFLSIADTPWKTDREGCND